MAMQRQTQSYLRGRFRESGFQPYAKRGQNFLIDLNLLEVLVEAAELQTSDVVLEVGTGTGSLTARVAPLVAQVISVEIDSHLAELAAEQLSGLENVTQLQQDALRNKNALHPKLIEAVEMALRQAGGRQLKLVANLPYNVATPLISNLLESSIVPASMTITIQRELAERIIARPSTKDYGSLSIWVQSQCDSKILRHLPPSAFWPRPKVNSAMLHIQVDAQRRAAISDLSWWHQYVRGVFIHRRKYLRSALLGAFKPISKASVDQVMQQLDLSAESRAEQLTVKQHLELSERLKPYVTEQG